MKNTVYIALAIILTVGLAISGYYVYDQNKGDKKEVEVVDYQTCKDNEGILSGNFNETCTKEDQDYTRELTDEELSTITNYDDCENLNGTISGEYNESCTVYNKEFTDTERLELIQTRLEVINLTIPEYTNIKLDDNLFQEIKKSITKIGGKDYYYKLLDHREYTVGGLVHIYVGFTNEDIAQLPGSLQESIGLSGIDEAAGFNIFYTQQDNGKYLTKIQNEKGIDEILDQIPDSELDPRAKDDYRYDEEYMKELERDLDLEKWIENYIKNHPES